MKTYMTLQAKEDEERVALEREVARLRAALEHIAEMADAMAGIAAAALAEGNEDG